MSEGERDCSDHATFFLLLSGCRRDKDGYYWITGRIDDMLNVSGAAVWGDNSCLCNKGYKIDWFKLIVILEAELFLSFTPDSPATSYVPHLVLSLLPRPLDEHCGGRGSPDGTPSCSWGCCSESASHGEGRMSLLLRHPQKQPWVQPHSGGWNQETWWVTEWGRQTPTTCTTVCGKHYSYTYREETKHRCQWRRVNNLVLKTNKKKKESQSLKAYLCVCAILTFFLLV